MMDETFWTSPPDPVIRFAPSLRFPARLALQRVKQEPAGAAGVWEGPGWAPARDVLSSAVLLQEEGAGEEEEEGRGCTGGSASAPLHVGYKPSPTYAWGQIPCPMGWLPLSLAQSQSSCLFSVAPKATFR